MNILFTSRRTTIDLYSLYSNFYSIVGCGPHYQLVTGVHYGGENIDKRGCGKYRTREALEAACTSNPACVGYSMVAYHIREKFNNYPELNAGVVGENGFYPWCLKRNEESTPHFKKTHNYCRKL